MMLCWSFPAFDSWFCFHNLLWKRNHENNRAEGDEKNVLNMLTYLPYFVLQAYHSSWVNQCLDLRNLHQKSLNWCCEKFHCFWNNFPFVLSEISVVPSHKHQASQLSRSSRKFCRVNWHFYLLLMLSKRWSRLDLKKDRFLTIVKLFSGNLKII